MKKAVIFDMDGVIVFSESHYRQRRKLFFAQHDIPLTDEFQEKLVGSNSRDMFELLIEDVEKRKWLIEQYAEFRANYPIDYREIFNAEMVRTLEALANQGIRMAVASSSSLETIQMILTENQILSYFELLVSGDKF
jgi:beta-phosphoglucomutase-like phosphatase (HAD superfamily)